LSNNEIYNSYFKSQLVSLKEIITLISGRDLNKDQYNSSENGIPYIMGASNMNEGTLYIERWTDTPTVIGRKGDIILSVKGTIGEHLILEEEEVHLSRQVMALRTTEKACNKYVFYFVKYYINRLKEKAKGLIPGITREDILNIEIPLYSIEEQKKIVVLLEKAQALFQKRKEAIAKLDELIQAVFLDMFGDPSNNQKSFPKGTIKDLILEAKYGTSKKANENMGEFPYLRMNNLTYKGYMDFSNLKYIDLDEKERDKYLVQEGDLLFNRTNSKELVGKTAVFAEKEPMVIAGYLIRVRVNELGNPYYISSYLNSKHGKMILQNMCKNIVGMANINAKEMQNIDILIPPKELQDRYEERYKEILKKKYEMNRQLKQLEVNLQSVLQRSFKGELKVKTEITAE